MFNVGIDLDTDYIKNISAYSTHDFFLGKDIRIDGIGIGNTFNEAYDKFGVPTSVYNSNGDVRIYYEYDNCFICFHSKRTMRSTTGKRDKVVNPCAIVAVSVSEN